MGFFIGCGVVLRQGGKYVLIREVRREKAGLYNLPAGTLELGEDFVQCITREAQEETGAAITLDAFLGVYQTVIASGSNVVFLVFSGQAAADAAFHSDEHDEVQALEYAQVAALERAGKLRSPIVMKAIDDLRTGKTLPLAAVQAWHVEQLASITVAPPEPGAEAA